MHLSNSNTLALGEQVEESRGKITGQRVLSVEGIPKMEIDIIFRNIAFMYHRLLKYKVQSIKNNYDS
jgi:hypothetical protein